MTTNNPLLTANVSPLFEEIEINHFEEALDFIYRELQTTFNQLKNDRSKPTFENTIAPLDSLFKRVMDISMILTTLNSCNYTKALFELIAKSSKKYNEIEAGVLQDRVYGARIKYIYDIKETLNLDTEDLWLLECMFYQFENAGAFLGRLEQKTLLEISNDLNEATQKFNQNLRASRLQQAIHIRDSNRLKGMPENIIEDIRLQAKSQEKKGWLIVPERRFIDLLLEVTDDRSLRREIIEALNRIGKIAPYDNQPVIQEIHLLRQKKARILGYKSYASYNASRSMAGDLKVAEDFLEEYGAKVLPIFERDLKLLQEWVDLNHGPKLEPWDIRYYKELYKRSTFKVDNEAIAEYLELESVLNGWIKHIDKSLNLKICKTEKGSYQTWHTDVIVYEIMDKDNNQKSLLFIDFYKRNKKRSHGLWANIIQRADPDRDKINIVILSMNLIKPIDKLPTLLDLRGVIDLFHEGGHAVNFVKSGYSKYTSRAADENNSDFSEIHSHLQENYAFQPEVLRTYARHYSSKKIIPFELISKKLEANYFLSSLRAIMILQSCLYDLTFHKILPQQYEGPEVLQKEATFKSPFSHFINPITLCRFHFIFRNSRSRYAANFWHYIWSEAAQAQVFQLFKKEGIYNEALLIKKRAFYSSGAKENPKTIFQKFAGKEAGDIMPLIQLKYGIRG